MVANSPSNWPVNLCDLAMNGNGFDAPCENSIDAVSDRDFLIEYAFVLSLIATHISKEKNP